MKLTPGSQRLDAPLLSVVGRVVNSWDPAGTLSLPEEQKRRRDSAGSGEREPCPPHGIRSDRVMSLDARICEAALQSFESAHDAIDRRDTMLSRFAVIHRTHRGW